MNAVFPFSLNGSFFSLKTVLQEEQGKGYKIQSSKRTRLLQPGLFLTKTNSRSLTSAKLVDLTLQLDLKIAYVRCDYQHFSVFLPDGNVKVMNWEFSELLLQDKTRKFWDKAGFNEASVKSFVENLVLPCSYSEHQLVAALVSDRLQQVYQLVKKCDFVVLGGELVWSGWLSAFTVVSSLLLSELMQLLIKVDGYGIFDYLLSQANSDKTIYKVNKSQLLPDLRYSNLAIKNDFGTKIQINNANGHKQISIVSKTNSLFDLGTDDYQITNDGTVIPRYLLLQNRIGQGILEQSFLKQQILLQGNFCQLHNEIPRQNLMAESLEKLVLTCPGEFTGNVKLGSEINLGQAPDLQWRIPSREIHKILKGFKLAVLEGQLVAAGEAIGYQKTGHELKRITAKYAGKVSLNLLEKGFVVIENEREPKLITSPISGKVIAIVDRGTLICEANVYKIPVVTFNGSCGGVLLRLSELRKEGIAQIQNSGFSLIIQIDSPADVSSLTTLLAFMAYPGMVTGIIFKEDNPELRATCCKQNPGLAYVILETNSKNCNPTAEWLLHYYQRKYIALAAGAVLLPAELLQGAESQLKDPGAQEKSLTGRAVKILHYQSRFLYGKIEKSLKSQGTILVNTPDGFAETRLENIYFID